MPTPTATPAAPLIAVPTMSHLLEGRSYGGQYWTPTEYEFTAAIVPGPAGPLAELALRDTAGRPLDVRTYDRTQLRALVSFLATPAIEGPFTGLNLAVSWRWGGNRDDAVLDGELAELTAWCRVALGDDPLPDPDLWEY